MFRGKKDKSGTPVTEYISEYASKRGETLTEEELKSASKLICAGASDKEALRIVLGARPKKITTPRRATIHFNTNPGNKLPDVSSGGPGS